MICIVKSSFSNWKSVYKAFQSLGLSIKSINYEEIPFLKTSSILVIPGVGHVGSLSKEISNQISIKELKDNILDKEIKIIGICLGFQFLCVETEEDLNAKCLGLLDLKVKNIFNPVLPSVGWKQTYINSENNIKDLDDYIDNKYFYFTHSFAATRIKSSSSEYTFYSYKSASRRDVIAAVIDKNIVGFQFHPEKSGATGLDLIKKTIGYLSNNH